jgi:DNA-directed RNA polymerase subunit RPC12/RpoP
MTIMYKCDICGRIEPAKVKNGIISAPEDWETVTYDPVTEIDTKYKDICLECRKTVAWLERSDGKETWGEAQRKPLPTIKKVVG